MKKIITHIVSLLIIYFVFSFLQWNFNPGLWSIATRAFWIVIASCVSFIILMISANNEE